MDDFFHSPAETCWIKHHKADRHILCQFICILIHRAVFNNQHRLQVIKDLPKRAISYVSLIKCVGVLFLYKCSEVFCHVSAAAVWFGAKAIHILNYKVPGFGCQACYSSSCKERWNVTITFILDSSRALVQLFISHLLATSMIHSIE